MADNESDQAGLLPEPDSAETLRLMMRGSSSDRPWWRRLLPPSLCSLGFHLFFLSLVAVVTVTFADEILSTAAWEPETYASDYTIDNRLDYLNLTGMDRDWPVKDVDELPPPAKEKTQDSGVFPPDQAGQGPPQPVQPVPPDKPKLLMKPARLTGPDDEDGDKQIVQP